MKLKATIIVTLGFGNHEATVSDLRNLYGELTKHRAPDVEVMLRPFDANWRRIADRIHQDSDRGALVAFVGHSYGCGWGLKRLARFLDENGRKIDMAFLIDPVIRWFQWLTPLNFLSLTRIGDFKLPANVTSAWSWRQVNNRPQGRFVPSPRNDFVHRYVYGSKAALAKRARPGLEEQCVDAGVTHSTIDGLPAIHRSINSLVKLAMSGVGARRMVKP
jgi:pimeloyl-ACP methyl ester carboxylesterase